MTSRLRNVWKIAVSAWRNRRADLSARLLALLSAAVLWFIASPDVPRGSGARAPVPAPANVVKAVEVRNVPAHHIVVGAAPRVEVSFTVPSGRDGDAALLIVPFVDVGGTDGSARSGSFPVRVDRPDDFRLLDVRPDTVDVKLDRAVTKDFPVQLGILGVPADAAVRAGDPVPGRVKVEGPSALVGNVALVVATVPFSAAILGRERDVAVHALDADGERVEGVTLIPNRVSVHVVVPEREDPADGLEKRMATDWVETAGNLAR